MRTIRGRVLWWTAGVTFLLGLLHVARVPAQPPAHGDHGTPTGWRLRWPAGDPRKGRDAFVRFECYSCHAVQGEQFPALGPRETLGPELSRMGALHEPEYFVEAIVNPSAVIEPGRGYEAADGSSKMPSYSDSMTVQELIDLVAYLRALRPGGAAPAGSQRGRSGEHDAHP
jgi:mono/diheme cytochrome c family protein